jgi:hypothetical protein
VLGAVGRPPRPPFPPPPPVCTARPGLCSAHSPFPPRQPINKLTRISCHWDSSDTGLRPITDVTVSLFIWVSRDAICVQPFQAEGLTVVRSPQCSRTARPRICHIHNTVFPVRYGLPTVYLCVPYGSHSKQRLFPHTALTGWAL